MHRLAPIALALLFIVSQICCAPPLRAAAFDEAEPMQCPISKEDCEASKPTDCSGGPQLVSEAPVKKFTAPQELRPVAATAGMAVAQAESVVIAGWWSVPTRTIQLRI
jgi:hypothetical protein